MPFGDFVHWCALSFVAGIVLSMLVGCSNLNGPKSAANALNASLDAVAPVLASQCIDPYMARDGMTMDEAQALLKQYDRSPCPRALRVYESARVSHRLLSVVIVAIEAGDCVNVSRSVSKCDLIGAVGEVVKATAEVAEVARALGAEQ